MYRVTSLFALLLLWPSAALGVFTCTREGIFADPDNCAGFIECANDDHGSYNIFYFECDWPLLYNEPIYTCDYDYNVICGTRPLPDGNTQPPVSSTSTTTTTTASTTAAPSPTTTTAGAPAPTSSASTTSTTTTPAPPPATTTTSGSSGNPSTGYPDKVLAMYILLADDTEEGFESDSDWVPRLYDYQVSGSNVLFFTFVNPDTMEIPKAFQKLSATRGTDEPGAVPADTLIIYAIGGYLYSLNYNPWHWLTSRDAAEAMAYEVATWPDRYNVDGIDLDIEEGAGSRGDAGPNMIHFVRKLKELRPDFIIGQPTYGYPAVQAEIDVINASWNVGQTSNNLASSVGLMVYQGTQALTYVENYAHGSNQWEGFPIRVDVPYDSILLGCKGSSAANDIGILASEVISQDLLGIMVWYVSAVDGLQYETGSWDPISSVEAQNAYVQTMQQFNQVNQQKKNRSS